MVLIAGEAGIGKSRLIEEFTARADQAGAAVAVGGAAPLTGGCLPYAPLAQALRVLAAGRDPASQGEEQRERELAALLSQPAAGSAAADRAWEPEAGRGRLFELLAGALTRFGEDAPVVLVLEDLHWADSATLDFLAFLLRNLRRDRVLVVGSYRVDDPGEWLPGWLGEARRNRLVSWLELSRLSRSELTALLTGVRGEPVDSDLAGQLFDRSQGNPFFAGELLAGAAAPGRGSLPQSLRDVLLARVHQLSPAGQRLLRAASAGGRWVGHDPLAAVAGGSPRELTEWLREAVDRGVLVVQARDEGGPDGYAFRHALLHEAVYSELLPGERAMLHESYARAFAAAPAYGRANDSRMAVELAEHWYLAGRPAEALDWSLRAAASADRLYAHADAARYRQRAIELWDNVPGATASTGADLVSLHTSAARAWEYAGKQARAEPHVDAALALLDPAADPVQAGVLHQIRGAYRAGSADVNAAMTDLKEAVRLVPDEPPSAERAQVLWAYGRVLHLQAGRDDEAAVAYAQALEAARRAGSQHDIARARAAAGHLQAVRGAAGPGLAMLREACASLERLAGEPSERAMAQTLLSDALLKVNQLDDAAEVALRSYARLRSLGLGRHHYAFTLVANAMEALFGLGRWDEASQAGAAMADLPVSADNTPVQLNLAELDGARGQLKAALARLGQVRRQCADYAWELGQRRAEVALWLGQPQAARTHVTRALDTVAGTSQERYTGWLSCLGLRALADIADLARARQDPRALASLSRDARLLTERVTDRPLAAPARPFAAAMPLVVAPAERATWAAELTRFNGVPDPAAWLAAADAWQGLNRGYRAAYALWRQAEAILQCGTGHPGDPLRAAHATAVQLGAAPLRAEIEALATRARITLATAPTATAAASAVPARPHGLTEREAEVLRLLAAGHTNKQIGNRLFISPKTASVHVTSILRKLAVRDRVQAATAAVRLGLADPATADHP
jgi:predicted ATPase/DNA-binding CsgD family transcriptional regulator